MMSFPALDESIPFLLFVTAGSALGGIMGAFFLKKARDTAVNYIFIALMFAAGVRLLFV